MLIQFGQGQGGACPKRGAQIEGAVRTRNPASWLLDPRVPSANTRDSFRVAPPPGVRVDADPEQSRMAIHRRPYRRVRFARFGSGPFRYAAYMGFDIRD